MCIGLIVLPGLAVGFASGSSNGLLFREPVGVADARIGKVRMPVCTAADLSAAELPVDILAVMLLAAFHWKVQNVKS